MPNEMACDHELCREPYNRKAYVATDEGFYCLYCYLVWECGVDAEEASDICFDGGDQ